MRGLDPATVRTLMGHSKITTTERYLHARPLTELAERLAAIELEWRDAVLLRDIEGLSTEEAAELVGVRQAAFKSRLHRGRMRLVASSSRT
jgi:RNA polymerase sigma-70 factor (ECF subfamily)